MPAKPGQQPLPSLSIFFPAFNEEHNIRTTIVQALQAAAKLTQDYEVICINDGSTDRTQEVVEQLITQFPHLRIVSHPTNLGYGAAIKSGLLAASKKWLFYTDSDGQFRFEQLAEFVSARDRADIVIGYRKHRQDPWIRIFIAKVLLRSWNFLLFNLRLRDVDCSYKLFPRQLLDGIELITASAITETELMVKFIRRGSTVLELPVQHYPRYRGNPTGSNPHVIFRALKESMTLWQELRFKSSR